MEPSGRDRWQPVARAQTGSRRVAGSSEDAPLDELGDAQFEPLLFLLRREVLRVLGQLPSHLEGYADARQPLVGLLGEPLELALEPLLSQQAPGARYPAR